jgi:4-aminobutyrate aminotransferase/(S)-3-amino-2-methylpropionate transaminase
VRARFIEFQKKYPIIGDVRGLGAMCAMELVKDRATREPDKEAAEEFTRRALQRGLITITAGTLGNCIRTLMPLIITDEEIEASLDIMDLAMNEASRV